MEKLTPYKITFYVPVSHVEGVKNAMFEKGAGRQGNYDRTCWQCLGRGQFRPLKNANPTIGSLNALTYVEEYKVEMYCAKNILSLVISALIEAHPYEEPAFDVIELLLPV